MTKLYGYEIRHLLRWLFLAGMVLTAWHSTLRSAEWAVKSGGNGFDRGHDVAMDESGASYVAGSFEAASRFGDGDDQLTLTARGRMDAFLAKYDEAGRLVWVQQAGSTSTVGTTERADRVALDGNGHVYVAGLFKAVGLFGSGSDAPQLVSAGEADYFVAQYDESGNVNWAIRIGTELNDTLIGDLAADGLGNVYFSFLGYPGTMVRDTTGIHSVPNIGSGDICTVKINSDGNFQWAVVIGSSSNDTANALAVAPNGDLLVSGIFFGAGSGEIIHTAGSEDLDLAPGTSTLLGRFTSEGQLLWQKIIPVEAGILEMNGLAFDSMGFFFAFGDMRGSAGIPGSTPDNQVRISSNPIFREDFFLGRFNGDGAIDWIQTFGSRNADLAAALDMDDQNNVWVTGTIQGDLVFHENSDSPVLYSGNRQESFLAQFSGGGSLTKAWKIGGPGGLSFSGGIGARAGAGRITGGFQGSAEFDGTKDLTLIAVSSDIYLANFQAPDRVDLNISITSETQDIQEGDPLGFRINVTNSGLTPATTIRISVPEPQGLKATVYSPSSGNFAANSATWELEGLEPGTSQSLTLSGIAGQSSPIIASPSVRHLDQLDIDRSNNQATFTVAPSLPPGSGLVVRNTANDGVGSLRNALEFANAHPNINGSPDLVVFEIPSGDPGCDPSGLCTIQLEYSLPPAREPILIDGLTQSGSQNISWPPQLKIVINGSNVRAGGVGLHLSAGQSTVRGLVIQGFNNSFNPIDLTSSGGAAILLEGPGGNRVTTCFLGTDASGLTGNSSIQNEYGIQILNSGANTIGGNQPTTRNLISNNDEAGILIMGQSATANFILGNFIGSDASGTKPLPNEDGIYIEDAPANFIGGPDRSPGILNGSGNLISGNDGAGIYIEGDNAPGQVIQGNFIGVDVSGMVALPNDDPGIDVDDGSGNHTIGGASAPGLSTLASNVISGNDSHAIEIADSDAHQNTIQGNYIGVALDGITPIPNRGNGITLSGDGNRIGGPEPQHRNLIASNAGSGIDFFASNDNVVQGNWIGVGNDGVTPLGNRDDGIDMTGAGNRIGGQNPNEGNIIAFNGRNGIAKYGLIGGSNENNQFTGNVIHHNTRLGIELNGDGVNPNVAAGSIDADPVAVALNYPVLNSLPLLTTEGSTTVSGVLQSIPLTLFRIEFFANESCDDSKFGEGQIYMGHLDVFTDVLGRVEFSTTLPNRPGIGAGWKVTATSTGPAGTSEFCQCDGFPSGAMVTNTSDSGPGSLREALSFARINPGPDTITFNIPTSDTGYDPAEGVWTISPQSPMPILNHPVVIDGLSQPGAGASNWPPVLKVEINGSAAGNFGGLNIGSPGVGIRGLILNRFMGAAISTAGNTANAAFIESNFIGTDAAGLSPRPNQQGVSLGGSGHRIVGNTAASGNLISGNLNAGVRIGGPDMSILNNLIGTTISGSQALGNEGPGVWLSSQGAIVTGNTISANGITGNTGSTKPNDGIFIQGNLNTVQGNKIGTDSSGNSPLANRGSGIEVFGGQQNLIGGASLTAANLIAHNGNDGVELNANISTMPRNNRITRNSFLMNGNLAIDLFGNGSTPNDTNDSDDGPNNLQNFPAIRLAQYDSSSGILSLTYQIDSHPNSSSYPLTTEFFVADPRKLEGQTFLGMDTFTVSDFQNVEPRRVLMSIPDGILHTGDSIVATATDNNGNTSEFSPAMIVTEFIAPPQLSVTFDPTTRTLTLIWPNRNGSTVQLESTETLSPPNWIPVTQGILAIENQFFYPIQFDSRNQSQFFRLR